MSIKNFIIFIIFAVSFQCKEKEDIKEVLTVDCFWDVSENIKISPINSCFKFEKNGSCEFYYYNFYNRKRTDSVFKFDSDDVVAINKWEIINDSKIRIMGIDYLLLDFTKNVIKMKKMNGDTLSLIKNCSTFISRK